MRTYVWVNWIGRFAASAFWGFLSLFCLLSAIDADRGFAFLGAFLVMLVTGYLSIGAFLNGCRVFVPWWRARYSWRAWR